MTTLDLSQLAVGELDARIDSLRARLQRYKDKGIDTAAVAKELNAFYVERNRRSPSTDAWLSSLPKGVDVDDYAEAVDFERKRRFAKRMVDMESCPPAAIPEFEPLKACLDAPAEPLTYRIEEWWTTGDTVVLAAQFKAGKTTLIGNLLRSLVDGDPWLGRWPARSTTGVTLLDFEMSKPMLVSWLRDQHIRNTEQITLVSVKGSASSFNILNPLARKEWATKIRNRGTRVLILDCLRPALDAIGLDEHKDAGRFFTAFDELLKDAGVSEAVVVHHMGHDSDRARGDSRIRDWPAAEWRLTRVSDDPASPRTIKAFGRGVNIPTGRLLYDPTTRRVRYKEMDKSLGGRDADVKGVLRVLATSATPLSQNGVIKAADGKPSEAAVKAVLPLCVDKGWASRTPGANNAQLHTITEAGREWLAGGAEPDEGAVPMMPASEGRQAA